ncbi:SubName: Full=Uncharacterized protein {ECO:0000313/EMBL:CCA67510.1} [Serendipita indica DSM 11827]|nr:SubName: Full=Uncharacterized protein {ECO:0000313/EMBL:CCA67510.1} [Serendipita indica DSM 11827]
MARVDARSRKAEYIKSLKDTITLPGKPISLQVVDGHVWTAESGAVARKTSLEASTGKTLQLFKGHTGPVTCLQIVKTPKTQLLLTGSWDKTMRVWDIASTKALSVTSMHSDFLKCLLVIPSLGLLISGSSDKTAKIWDFEQTLENAEVSPNLLGIISEHTRPVECLAYDSVAGELYTADSMGRILVWRLEIAADRSTCRAYNLKDVSGHRTGINDILVSQEGLWTASTDETVIFHPRDAERKTVVIKHKHPVKSILLIHVSGTDSRFLVTGSGEIISTFEVTNLLSGNGDIDSLGVTDAHAHNITNVAHIESQVEYETSDSISVLSAGLDGLVRKWKLADLITGVPDASRDQTAQVDNVTFTEEEERELAELLDAD